MKHAILILAPGFEELEAVGTADVLKRCGIAVTLAGMNETAVTGAHGFTIAADRILDDCDAAHCDAVVLPGGMPGAANLRDSAKVIDFVKAVHGHGKVVSAICAAPIVLARAGLLTDGKFTMYPGFERFLNGLNYTAAPAETCGRVVTGRGPGAVFAFAAAIVTKLGASDKLPEVFSGMFIKDAML